MRKLLLFVLLFAPSLLQAQTGGTQPILRAKVVPADKVIVGQPVRLVVEVLVPNYFTGAPNFPPFELDGAIVTLSDDRPEHFNEQINGITFAGIRRFYLIYAEQPGKFVIPSVTISVPYASKPPETTKANLNLPALTFTAALPVGATAGAKGLDYFLPTTQLTIRQQWSAPLSHLRVGDSLSRTVVVTAQKMQAMLIPPLELSAPEGVRVYPKNPEVEGKKSPIGEFLAGVRTERASYVFTRAGDYTLPAVEISWWDLTAQKMKTSKLPAVEIQVNGADSYVSELPPEPPQGPAPTSRNNLRDYLPVALKAALALLLLAVVVFLVYRLGPPLLGRITAARHRRQESEPAYWRRLNQALHRNDASHSYALLLAWIRRAHGDMSLSEFLETSADPQLNQQILALSQTLYAPNTKASWDGQFISKLLSRRRKVASPAVASNALLPPLNPV
jgi:hypothetical protein